MTSNRIHGCTVAITALLAGTLSLAGCGGGGGGGEVASIPAPPPVPGPTAAAAATTNLQAPPATTTGSYTGISTFAASDASGGSLQAVAPEQLAPAGSVKLAVDASAKTYTLTVTAGPYTFPSGTVTMPDRVVVPLTGGSSDPSVFSPEAQIARGELLVRTVGAGTDANGVPKALTTWLRPYYFGNSDVQPRYLSAAGWGQYYSENASGVPGPENYKRTQLTSGFMVYGQRTAPGDIPASGRARYALESSNGGFDHPYTDEDGNLINPDGDTVLDVDFENRGLSATYELTGGDDQFKTTVRASGSTTIDTSGSFSLLLAGTGSVHAQSGQPPVPDISKPVGGEITGAFFGPQAAEVGGVWMLPSISQDGSVTQIPGAFAGIRSSP